MRILEVALTRGNSPDPKDIIITLPSTIKWEEYQKELDAVADGNEVMNYKLPSLPKGLEFGKSRCYLVHKGYIRGYMIISGTSTEPFECSTTGKKWEGKFIQRTGKFFPLANPVELKGFMGWRYYNPDIHK